MGCTTSCFAPSIAELNKSVKTGDDRAMLMQLSACPKLLSTPTSVLSSSAVTPLHQACGSKQVKVVEQILCFMACSSLEIVREALLPYCRRVGQQLPASVPEAIRLAVDMANAKGQTPLMYACFSDCPELVKLLLAKGADPWVRDRCGRRTALHYAAMGGSPACIQALMKHIPPRLLVLQGVRYVDARSLCGLTPLHYCVYYGNLEALRELLAHCDPDLGAATSSESYDVSVTCEARSGALHFAAVTGNEEAAREVLRCYLQHQGRRPAIADPRTRLNAAGQLPWQVALAHHPGQLTLTALLHPGQPLERALGAGVAASGAAGGLGVGPQSLAAIAADALRTKLMADLQLIQDPASQAGAAVASGPVVAQRPQREEAQAAGAEQEIGPPAVASAVSCPACRGGGGSPDGETPARLSARCGSSGRGRRSATVAPLPTANNSGSTSGGNGGCNCCRPSSSRSSAGLNSAAADTTAAAGTAPALQLSAMCGPGGVRHLGLVHAAAAATQDGRKREEQPCVGEGADEAIEADEEVEQCEVCFAARVAVTPAGCRHGLCGGCAEQLCRGLSRRPLRCPFCRGMVTGFVGLAQSPQQQLPGRQKVA